MLPASFPGQYIPEVPYPLLKKILSVVSFRLVYSFPKWLLVLGSQGLVINSPAFTLFITLMFLWTPIILCLRLFLGWHHEHISSACIGAVCTFLRPAWIGWYCWSCAWSLAALWRCPLRGSSGSPAPLQSDKRRGVTKSVLSFCPLSRSIGFCIVIFLGAALLPPEQQFGLRSWVSTGLTLKQHVADVSSRPVSGCSSAQW